MQLLHLVSTSFHDVLLTLLIFLFPLGWRFLTHGGSVPSEFSAPKALCQEEYSVHFEVFLFLCRGFFWGHFYMSAKMLLQPGFISLICTSELQPF